MPYQEVMPKFKRGELHSGSKKGPVVKDRDQAVAIMLSEKRKGTHEKKGKKGKKARGMKPKRRGHTAREAAMALRGHMMEEM